MAAGRTSTELSGIGLHLGAPVRVGLHVWDGPLAFERGNRIHPLAELRVADTRRATTLASVDGAFQVGTVEHLLAAIAALGIRQRLLLSVDGPELPLLGGGAAEWYQALSSLALEPEAPRLVVARDADIEVDESRFAFRTGPRTTVSVEFVTPHPLLERHAIWDGTEADFAGRIAHARTFVHERDLEQFEVGAIASYAPPESVIVLTDSDVLCAGAPFTPDEPARHKLLDLIGDLGCTFGPPCGGVHAVRPGHRANHAAIELARNAGVLVVFS